MFSQQEIGCTNAKVLAAVSRWSAIEGHRKLVDDV